MKAVALLVLLALFALTSNAYVYERVNVIVIGAGPAGLAAAQTLQSAGVTLRVLEARDRIGGRVETDYSLGYPVELGAQYIVGYQGNPLTTQAANAGIMIQPFPESNRVVYEDGNALASQLLAQMGSSFDSLINSANTASSPGVSLSDAMSRGGNGALTREQNFSVAMNISNLYGADLSQMDSEYWDSAETFNGGNAVLPGGFQLLVNSWASNIQSNIHTSVIVASIMVSGGGITVISTIGDVYVADYVLCAVPLGLLQSGFMQFDPALSQAKQEAINNYGVGTLDKVVLQFPPGTDLGSSAITEIITQHGTGVMRFVNWQSMVPGSGILIGEIGGSSLPEGWEQLTNDEILVQILAELRTAWPNLPDPLNMEVTRWGNDRFALGATSFVKTGSTPNDRAIMSAPVGHLYFAGEYASSDYPNTVHGAYLSGVQTANDLFTAFKVANPNWVPGENGASAAGLRTVFSVFGVFVAVAFGFFLGIAFA